MKQIASWFKNTVTTFLDPERESRVETLVKAIQRGIQAQGQQFNLDHALLRQELTPPDLHEAKIRVYRGALERGWAYGELTAGEQRTAKWLAERLSFHEDEARTLNIEQARKTFGLAL